MASAWNDRPAYTNPSSTDEPPPYYSVVGDIHQSGKFTFVDFLPQCYDSGGIFTQPKYEGFSALINNANNWLRTYPGWEIITCESVEFTCSRRTPDSETMLYIEYGEHINFYVRGLRLWIREKKMFDTVQQIGYVNLVPQQTVQGGIFSRPKFESLIQLVERFNYTNRMNPLPGRILTVESQEIKTQNWNINADRSFWSERGDMSKCFVFVIRIFYLMGPPEPVEIGMADFLPDIVESGGIFSYPKYEPFSNVIHKASQWISSQPGIRICSAQSLEIRIKRDDVNTHKMEYMEYGSTRTCYARILRLAFIKPSQFYVDNSDPSFLRRLTCRSFVPVQLTQGVCNITFETLSQTKERVSAWIRASGAHVISAETVSLRLNSRNDIQNGTQATFTHTTGDMNQYRIFIIRLYLSDDFRDPPPEALPPVPAIVDTGCCVLL